MLTRSTIGVSIMGVLGALLAFTLPAFADGSAQCTQEVDPNTGQITWKCEDSGSEPGGEQGGDTEGASSTCSSKGVEIPCTGPEGSRWNGHCYVGDVVPGQQPGPSGESNPAEGRWHVCFVPPGMTGPGQVWVGAGALLVDPVTLANRAIAEMDLDPITIGIVPESGPNHVGLVGMPVWMWAESPTASTYGPITRSAGQGPVSVTATARVTSIVWDMGDGTKITCSGPGTKYQDRFGKRESPDCGHRYKQMSFRAPGGAYAVTATSYWVVEWTGGGQSGAIEMNLVSELIPIRIGEAQALAQ